MRQSTDYNINYALLALQTALLGSVTPNLRVVSIDLAPDKKIILLFIYYNGKISELEMELARMIVTETSAAFPPGYTIEDEIQRIDYPNKIPKKGKLAFLRNE